MNRLLTRILVLILLLVVAVSCSTATETDEPASPEVTTEAEAVPAEDETATDTESAESSAASEEMEMTPIKLVILPFLSFAPFYIGVDEGYFADQGLDIEIINMTSMGEIVPALASGQVDIASGLVSAGVLNAIARGGEMKYVADKGYIDPAGCDNYAIFARKELADSADFSDPATWAGLNLNVVPATWLEYYLDLQLDEIGAPRDTYVLQNVNSPAQPEALAQGSLDVVLNNEPWLSIFSAAGHKSVGTPVTELLPDSQGAVIFFGPNMLNADPEIGNRFMEAYLQSVAQYNEGATDRNLEILLNYIQIDPELLENICWPAVRADGRVDMESVLDFQDWAVEKGIMEAPLTAEQIYDSSYIEAANAAIGN
jgi:NitT/TauT family transport system substrate-binding protein